MHDVTLALEPDSRETAFRSCALLYNMRAQLRVELENVQRQAFFAECAHALTSKFPRASQLEDILDASVTACIVALDARMWKYERQNKFMTMQIAGLILNPNYGKPGDVLPLVQVNPDDPPVDARLTAAVKRAENFIREFLETPAPREAPATPMPAESSWMNRGRLIEDAAKDELTRWRDEKALPRMSLIEYWDHLDRAYPGLARASRRISVCPASATIVERMFSGGRNVLPSNMAGSDRATISKRFFLHVNRDAAVELIRRNPALRPIVRIATQNITV
jgi:hypothetical protein